MRLLIRQAAGTGRPGSAGDGLVLAASPDSPRPEKWLWDVRWESRALDAPERGLTLPLGGGLEGDGGSDGGCGDEGSSFLNVRFDPEVIAADVEIKALDGVTHLTRPQEQLWIALALTGELHEGHFDVRPGDLMVWEGDDPVTLTLSVTGGAVRLAWVRLSRVDGQILRWVP